MNAFSVKRRYVDSNEFQAPLRKRRYVPAGQIVPLNKRTQLFPTDSCTYEMNPIALQQMRDYEMDSIKLANETNPKSDMSMALVVYKRPDLITPIDVNDCDDYYDELNKKKKSNNNKSSSSSASSSYSYSGYNYSGYSSGSDSSSDMELD